MRSGVRCALVTATSKVTFDLASRSAAGFKVSQSESLPMTSPTSALARVSVCIREPFGPSAACADLSIREPFGPSAACADLSIREPFGPSAASRTSVAGARRDLGGAFSRGALAMRHLYLARGRTFQWYAGWRENGADRS